ncbi:MAG: hypothetical protein ABI233_12230, partial [Chthoniobacterales bacterium]
MFPGASDFRAVSRELPFISRLDRGQLQADGAFVERYRRDRNTFRSLIDAINGGAEGAGRVRNDMQHQAQLDRRTAGPQRPLPMTNQSNPGNAMRRRLASELLADAKLQGKRKGLAVLPEIAGDLLAICGERAGKSWLAGNVRHFERYLLSLDTHVGQC